MCLLHEIYFVCGHAINCYELCDLGANEPIWNTEACSNYQLDRTTSEQQCGTGGFFCQRQLYGNHIEGIIRKLQDARKMEQYFDTELGSAKVIQDALKAYFAIKPDQEHHPGNQADLNDFGAFVFRARNGKQVYNSVVRQCERELATAEIYFTQIVPAALARGEKIPDLVMPYMEAELLPAELQDGRLAQQIQQTATTEQLPQHNSVTTKSTRSSSMIKDELHQSTLPKKSSKLASPMISSTPKRETLPASTLIDYPAVADLLIDTNTGDRSSAINALINAELEKARNETYNDHGYMHDPATQVKAKRVMRRADYEKKVKTEPESTTSTKIEDAPTPAARPQRTVKKNINYDETTLNNVMVETAAKSNKSSPALHKSTRLGNTGHSLIVKLKYVGYLALGSLETSKTGASLFTSDDVYAVRTPAPVHPNTVFNEMAAIQPAGFPPNSFPLDRPVLFSVPAASQIFSSESRECSFNGNSPVTVGGLPTLLPSVEIHSKANLDIMFTQPFKRESSTSSELGFHHIKRHCTPEEDAIFKHKRARFDLDMEDETMDFEDDATLSLD